MSQTFVSGWSAMAEVEKLISDFNKYYLADPATRTGLFYIENIYNKIKSNYWNILTDSRKTALTTKVNAYQVRLRAVEAGMPYPPIQKTEPTVFEITPEGITLPSGIKLPAFLDIYGFKIPTMTLIYATTGLGALFMIPRIFPPPKKGRKR